LQRLEEQPHAIVPNWWMAPVVARLIRRATFAGLAAARAEGRDGGPPC
jgi:hypothetical protein